MSCRSSTSCAISFAREGRVRRNSKPSTSTSGTGTAPAQQLVEVFRNGFDPRASGHGGWFDFVSDMGDAVPERPFATHGRLLREMERPRGLSSRRLDRPARHRSGAATKRRNSKNSRSIHTWPKAVQACAWRALTHRVSWKRWFVSWLNGASPRRPLPGRRRRGQLLSWVSHKRWSFGNATMCLTSRRSLVRNTNRMSGGPG